MVEDYITSTLSNSRDVVCGVYAPHKLPYGYKISSNYWNNLAYEPTYYVWMYGGTNCDIDKMTMRCNQNVDAKRYNSQFTNCKGKILFSVSVFYQESFSLQLQAIASGSSSKYKMVAGSDSCLNCALINSEKVYIGLSSTSRETDACRSQLHYQKVTLKQSKIYN